MSKEAVREFRALVNADASLQDAVRGTALNLAQLVALGKAHGFEFTPQELEAIVDETELSELELELVSGGAGVNCGSGGGSQG
ncbi:MAG: Nif11-like leader peptide family natural product precursor [Planctomycetes bacterium]|nr:Nif11-like leader peptide family natural product precursor [Planctomycetota bacterium]